MLEKLQKTFEQECKYKPGAPYLVGVSGGPDSLALLHGLHSLGVPVIAGHLDHGIRAESEEDLRFVAKFSQQLGIGFLSKQVDAHTYASENKLSLEEAGRELRYTFLFEQADKVNAAGVIVGHNADDQVETVLMHLLRGAGLDGLSGMGYTQLTHWHDTILLLRPLLGIWRKEIEVYCEAYDLHPRFDRSNLDTTFFRNRIRNELLPDLESYNPSIKLALWKTANTLKEDREVLDGSVTQIFQECVQVDKNNGEIKILRGEFVNKSLGVQRRLIRLGIQRLKPEIRDVGFHEVEKVIGYIFHPPRSGSADLFQGMTIILEPGLIILAEGMERNVPQGIPQLEKGELLSLPIPGEVAGAKQWIYSATRILASNELLKKVYSNSNPLLAYLDAAQLPAVLTIASRKAGDRFSPLGLEGATIKVSDFMINVKTPKYQRKLWPLVYAGNEIVWIPGHQIAHDFRVTEKTKEVVVLSMRQNKLTD